MSVLMRRGVHAEATMDQLNEAVKPLLADGWTVESAYNHAQGMCDPAICCGHFPGTERLMLVCQDCGEAFDTIQTAWDHDNTAPQSFTIGYESDVM